MSATQQPGVPRTVSVPVTGAGAAGQPLIYEGDHMMLGPDEGAWVPVRRRGEPAASAGTEVALAVSSAESHLRWRQHQVCGPQVPRMA